MTRRLLAALGAVLLLIALPVVRVEAAPPAPGAPIAPLERGHAHNDYLNNEPLLDALGKGFTSIEADVFLRDGSLVLCHEYIGPLCADDNGHFTPAKPFESLYLQRLSNWVTQYGGQVYADYTQPIYLYVEIKCMESAKKCVGTSPADPNNPTYVYSKIVAAVDKYRSMLYHVAASTRHWGPVQVVITGGHNNDKFAIGGGAQASVRDLIQRQTDRYVFLDGGANDAGDDNADMIPTISLASGIKDGCGRNGGNVEAHWDTIFTAQQYGHHVRIYELPDCPRRGDGDTGQYRRDREAGWMQTIHAGADYISSDHLTFLRDWLTDNAQGGGGGDCGISTWIDWANHYGQYCSVWKTGVPVHRSPDGASPQVGQLNEDGYANWFVGQQPGEEYTYDGAANYWWAYTQADNGQWGWVSIVYFSGGYTDHAAIGLQYSCYGLRLGQTPDCHPL